MRRKFLAAVSTLGLGLFALGPGDMGIGTASSPIPGNIDTYAGGGIGDGGPALAAVIKEAGSVETDDDGNLYVYDSGFCLIRRVDAAGVISTLADNGLCGVFDMKAGTGKLYLAQPFQCAIRSIDLSTGLIDVVLGTSACASEPDGPTSANTRVYYPVKLAVTSSGDVFFSEGLCRIRRFDPANELLSTISGNGTCSTSGDGGPATSATLANPAAMDFDAAENLIITTQCRVRRINAVNSTIQTIAGTGSCGVSGDGGIPAAARVSAPRLAVSGTNVYLIESCRVRLLAPDISIGSVVGNGDCSAVGVGDPQLALNARTSAIFGVVDPNGRLYLSEEFLCSVRKVEAGFIDRFVGRGDFVGNGVCGRYGGDGYDAGDAALYEPVAVSVNALNDVYITESRGCRIRRVDGVTHVITTVAGNGCVGICNGSLDCPDDASADSQGRLYVARPATCNVLVFAPGSPVGQPLFAGGQCAYEGDGGLATNASASFPQEVSIDGNDNIYIADLVDCRIRRIAAQTGIVTTVAGNGNCATSGDGQLATAAGIQPRAIGVSSSGDIAVIDGCRVRLVSAQTGRIHGIAGTEKCERSEDVGPAIFASLDRPSGIAIGDNGDIFIADPENCRVHIIVNGIISTLAGSEPNVPYCAYFLTGDGGAALLATLDKPVDVAVNSSGDVYIAEDARGRVRIVYKNDDLDGDGVSNHLDICPFNASTDVSNHDGDLIDLSAYGRPFNDRTWPFSDTFVDSCDTDDDNDGVADSEEVYGCRYGGAMTNPIERDTDGDRVLDGAECFLGSDGNDPASVPVIFDRDYDGDGDGDGVYDGYESERGWSPTDSDSDDDGLSDGLEFKFYGSNPVSVDSDLDGCRDGKEAASVNGDRVVNVADLGLVASTFGPSFGPRYVPFFDINRDGMIGVADMGIVASQARPPACS